MLYRLYTQNTKLAVIKSILNRYCEAYTILPGTGVYRGVEELCLVIEIGGVDKQAVESAAQEIATDLKQQCVIVTGVSEIFVHTFSGA